MLDSTFDPDTIRSIEEAEVEAYRIRRSPTNNLLFNVYAVDYLDRDLFIVVAEQQLDTATRYAVEFNEELDKKLNRFDTTNQEIN